MATRDDDDPEINFVPGLYKIFDEILVNACDNFQRDPEHMTYIKAFGVCVDDRNMLEIYSKSVLAWHVGLKRYLYDFCSPIAVITFLIFIIVYLLI